MGISWTFNDFGQTFQNPNSPENHLYFPVLFNGFNINGQIDIVVLVSGGLIQVLWFRSFHWNPFLKSLSRQVASQVRAQEVIIHDISGIDASIELRVAPVMFLRWSRRLVAARTTMGHGSVGSPYRQRHGGLMRAKRSCCCSLFFRWSLTFWGLPPWYNTSSGRETPWASPVLLSSL